MKIGGEWTEVGGDAGLTTNVREQENKPGNLLSVLTEASYI